MGTVDLPRNSGPQDLPAREDLRRAAMAILNEVNNAVGKFNSGEIEKLSEANINDLETYTNTVLRKRTGIQAILRGDSPGSLVKCAFRDNALKPRTVTDLKLAINVPDSDPPQEGRQPGFAAAANLLIAILDKQRLDYQFVDMGEHEAVIREYEDDDAENLPDERFEMRLRRYSREQLAEAATVYDAHITGFVKQVQHLWDLVEVIYQDSKHVFKVNDFEDLAKKNKSRIRDLINKKPGEDQAVVSGEGAIEMGNIRAKLARINERIKNMYEYLYPIERRVMEDRLAWLETEHSRLDFVVNPRHLQSGLLIDVTITSIKRKKTTVNAIAGALNEFLQESK
ncbi:MAG: hypothetical protein LBI06_04965 [Treponema sp.]|jgi:hypothetical protein|nr:hypothetical protein [Treponema sp.]